VAPRVLLDGRVRGRDGIGRYTNCLAAALTSMSSGRPDLSVFSLAGHSLYDRVGGEKLVADAARRGCALIHLVDYRVPLGIPAVPLIVTVHDLLRLTDRRHCYTDLAFATKFGASGLAELRSTVHALRDQAELPPGSAGQVHTTHEEFLGRMLMLSCARAARIVTPTARVANELQRFTGCTDGVRVLRWGADHLPGSGPSTKWPRRPYLLYVGQARSHKGLPLLLAAYRRSVAPTRRIPIVFVGRDFGAGQSGTSQVRAGLGALAVTVGEVSDARLAGLLGQAMALVHLAEHEGFGFTPLEAMRLGTRVIVRDLPVLRETLGRHARFVRSKGVVQVAEAIDDVVTTPDNTAEQDRRLDWARRYSWSSHAQEIAALYREVSP